MLRDREQGSKAIRAVHQSLSQSFKRIGGGEEQERRKEKRRKEKKEEGTYNNTIPLSLSNLFPIQSKEIRSFM
jgi:hypothetical protein